MLKECRAYPEGFAKIANCKTPCHAATISGNHLKLNVLLNDIKQRKAAVKSSLPMSIS